MTNTSTSIIDLDRNHQDQAAAWITRAFADDPFNLYILGKDVTEKQHQWYNGKVVQVGLKFGLSLTNQGLHGSAIWMKPGKCYLSTMDMIRCGLPFLPLKLGWSAFKKFMHWIEVAEDKHRHYMEGDHWYLLSLAVDPSHQGKGLGSALIREVTLRADEQRLPCYLESSTTRSRDLYQRHGFQVVEEVTAGPDGPPVWLMRREKIV